MAIKITRFVDPEKLQVDLAFTEMGVNDAMMKHAGLYAHYATLCFKADDQISKAKQVYEITHAKVDSEIRSKAVADDRKITEKMVEAEAARDGRVVGAKKAMGEAQAIAGLCRHAVDAFRQRKDMLVQVASNRREEYKGQVRLNGPAGQRDGTIRERLDAIKPEA